MAKAVCRTCGNMYDSQNIPETHPYRHPVDGQLIGKSDEQAQQEASEAVKQLPSDPVLRFALINKGVLSPLDLTEAEQTLAASGFAIAADSHRRGAEAGGKVKKELREKMTQRRAPRT